MISSVRILMATYNGQNYIQDQIESIINQTYSDWSLIVQDDGSTDDTWSILESFAQRDTRITIRKSAEEKHGAYCNFHSLANIEKLSGIQHEYYMFCDQDDIWDSDKIERMLKQFTSYNDANPVFCYADMRVIDATGAITTPSICSLQGLKYVNPESLFFSHIIYGCNTIMNRSAFFSVPILDISRDWVNILSHDNLYAKFSSILGVVKFIPESTMSYRRHTDNVTSKQQYGFSIKRIIQRLRNINELAKDHALTYNQSLVAIQLLGKDKASELVKIEKVMRSGGFQAFKYIRNKRISWGNGTKDISRTAILFSKLYIRYLFHEDDF